MVIQPVSKELADSFGLAKPQGALVSSVEKGGPAEKAGIEPGDVILRFDNRAVGSSEDLPRIVGGTKPGSKSTVQVWRNKATRELPVIVAELQEDRTGQKPTRGEPPRGARGLRHDATGVTEARKRTQGGNGVLVGTRRAPRAPASAAATDHRGHTGREVDAHSARWDR